MRLIPLTNNYALAVEHITNRRMRLIVYKNGEEYVCRKENRKQLNDFLNTDEAKAFKGRLQLLKQYDDIGVEVKGQLLGMLHKADFETLLVY